MLFRSGRAPWIVGSLLLVSAGCSRRNLAIGDGTLAGLGGKGGGSNMTDAAQPDGSGAGGQPATGDSGASLGGQGGIDRLDAAESGCVTAAIPLPWTKMPIQPGLRLAVVASSDAIAVMNRL